MTAWQMIIWEPVRTMLHSIKMFTPFLLAAVLILLIGWIIANVLKGIVQKVLDQAKFNDFSRDIGFADILAKGNVGLTPSGLLSGLVYWAVMIVVFAVAVDAIGLKVAADLMAKLAGYIPHVASSIFIVFVGMFLARLVAGIVRASMANAGLPRAELLASIAKGSILIFVAVMALQELEIASFFVTTTFQIFFGALCFALALAFGLGAKDLAAKILWDFYNKQNINK
ncbi:MAG: hypothetical protein HQL18_02270 [Candidatus Omnitrophica bacterium]|nr:hypothetical protein [Candidatus Omnitrophota bacterium]